MALVIADRVQETTTTTGTGTVTLGGASSGYQSFAVIGDGNTTYYAIVDSTAGDWEVGIGTYTSSGTTLSRDTVLSSSNSGSLVSFGAGSKNVFVTYPSGRAVTTDGGQTLTNKTFTGYTETVYTLGTSGSIALNPANGTIQTTVLSGNPTFTDSLSSGQSLILRMSNGSSYTVTWPTMTWVSWTGNFAPVLTTSDVLVFWKISSTLYGAWIGSYQ
jgi:hypothetical protein